MRAQWKIADSLATVSSVPDWGDDIFLRNIKIKTLKFDETTYIPAQLAKVEKESFLRASTAFLSSSRFLIWPIFVLSPRFLSFLLFVFFAAARADAACRVALLRVGQAEDGLEIGHFGLVHFKRIIVSKSLYCHGAFHNVIIDVN